MKLLFCQDCGDIIAPRPTANVPRDCACGRHAVWWVDPSAGILRVCDRHGFKSGDHEGWPRIARAFVLGMHNAFLTWPEDVDAKVVSLILDSTPDSYLFKRQNSVVIRIRPGESGDTRWAALPVAKEPAA